MAKKSWQEKLRDDKDLPKVVKLTGAARKRMGGATMALPTPREVDAVMRRVPPGRLITIADIRARLAKKHGAETACPLVTGIFSWIAAHAADEAATEGKAKTTPYWRTLKTGGELNPKYPGGPAGVSKLLEAEGHRVVQKGKRFFVADYETKLIGRKRAVAKA